MQNSRVFRNLILLADPPWTGDWDVNGANESFSRKEIRGVSVYSVTKQLLLRQQVALHRLLFCRKWEWIFSKQHLPAAKQLLRICWCVAGLGKSSGRGRCGLWLLSGGYPESSSGATELHLTTTTTLLVKKRKEKKRQKTDLFGSEWDLSNPARQMECFLNPMGLIYCLSETTLQSSQNANISSLKKAPIQNVFWHSWYYVTKLASKLASSCR